MVAILENSKISCELTDESVYKCSTRNSSNFPNIHKTPVPSSHDELYKYGAEKLSS